jgi:hypothetical protein
MTIGCFIHVPAVIQTVYTRSDVTERVFDPFYLTEFSNIASG